MGPDVGVALSALATDEARFLARQAEASAQRSPPAGVSLHATTAIIGAEHERAPCAGAGTPAAWPQDGQNGTDREPQGWKRGFASSRIVGWEGVLSH